MLILIDGYNVIAPVAPPGKNPAPDWLHRERMTLIDRLANQLAPQLAAQTCVVFDAPSRTQRSTGTDTDGTFRLRQIEVRFAVNHAEADDLIEELIALHSSPKRLTVVSSDHRLQAAAKRYGATAFDSQPWLDALLDGRMRLAIAWPPAQRDGIGPADDHGLAGDAEKSDALDDTTVQQWMQAFGITPGTPVHPKRPENQQKKPPESNTALSTTAPSKTVESTAPKAQPRAQKRPPNTRPDQKPPSDPKRIIDGDNPFPEGYGEDLL